MITRILYTALTRPAEGASPEVVVVEAFIFTANSPRHLEQLIEAHVRGVEELEGSIALVQDPRPNAYEYEADPRNDELEETHVLFVDENDADCPEYAESEMHAYAWYPHLFLQREKFAPLELAVANVLAFEHASELAHQVHSLA